MRIGELSARTGVSARSIRYYEQQGLLAAVRTASGQRVFAESAVDRVRLVQRLFDAGLSSRRVAELLPCVTDRRQHHEAGMAGMLSLTSNTVNSRGGWVGSIDASPGGCRHRNKCR
ncbi:MerR family transcriptional regulator [Micromonospora marina]|uniref:MerR family transcriptional regulator n=1 Tax=Micromonospora marina TaxID=307120 RepID=UPI003456AB29